MRDEYHPPRYTTILIVVLLVAFVLQSICLFYGGFSSRQHPDGAPYLRLLALSLTGIRHGYVWQFLTFQFLHSTPWPWHVLVNCLFLYFFGRSVETMLGSKKFLGIYLLAGFAGGALQIISTLVLPGHDDIPVVGASAGICGLIGVFCSLTPMRELTAWIYFFPITIRARYFLWFLTGLSIYGTIIPFDNVAHGAHLGGLLLGIAYVRWWHDPGFSLRFWTRWRLPRRRTPIVKVRFPKATPGAPAQLPLADEQGATDFISKEVDPILEKISASGIHSLTDRERKILEAARSKMEKR